MNKIQELIIDLDVKICNTREQMRFDRVELEVRNKERQDQLDCLEKIRNKLNDIRESEVAE
jgi:hypothetical protein